LVYKTNHRWQEFFKSTTAGGFAERMELCFRAQLLDEIIDTLADYVQAHTVPSNQGWVEEVKKKQHQEALRRWHKSEWSQGGAL
jgi:hypothetical protein